MRAADENNVTAVTAADENNPTAVTAADEEVTAAVDAPATLQVTTEEKAVTTEARAPEVSFVRKFKRFKFFFYLVTKLLIRSHTHILLCYLCLTNGLHETF